MGEFDELIEEFVTESREHIADIEDDLIKIESDMENIDSDVINRVFRAAHSIKGSAKFLDLINIGNLAHKMEDVLNLIRSGKLIPTSAIANPLLQSADMLKSMFEDVMASNDMDISEHVNQLQSILDGGASKAPPEAKKSKSGTSGALLDAFDLDREIIAKKLEHAQVYIVELKLKKTELNPFMDELNNLGELLGTCQTPSGNSRILFTSIMEPEMVPMALDIESSQVTQVHSDMLSTPKIEVPVKHSQDIKPKRQEKSPAKQEQKTPPPIKASVEVEPQESEEIEALEPSPTRKPFSRDEEPEKPEEEDNSFITFSLEEETYAVPIRTIEEIIGLQDISLLPNVPDFIKGVINLRGDLVPIMDLRLKLGLEEKEYNPLTVFLIVRVEERVMGMVVDNVADVLVIDPLRIQKTPSFSAHISTDFIEGVYKDTQEQMVILVNLPSLIKPDEWEVGGYKATSF
ncbi:MAG TPA: hypothetical protein ENN05_12150 [Deltaproteobacteria bacterium]|nr:hypothetical protein [Deltaproteobacteria bacterium]